MNRLPKQFWRIKVMDSSKLRTYDRASKTYASEVQARSAEANFIARGIPVEIWTTGPVTWTKVENG